MSKIYSLSVILLLALVQAACSLGTPTRPSDFYVLSSERGEPVSGRSDPAEPLIIGLGPLNLPDVFDRPQIVTRPEANRINLAEFDRWGGDLSKNLHQVMARNLMSRLNTDSVVAFPWSGRHEPDLQITVQFFRFDGILGEEARVEGVWRILDGEEGCELAADSFSIKERPAGSAYSDFVSAMSHGVARLSQDIALRTAGIKAGCK